jgi:hypothetical protein
MAIIDTKTKAMRKVEDEEIEKYAAAAKEGAGRRSA